ncbi:hypothetical protein JOC93_002557 [Priestia taiwanensis]|nr:hypothetical protein [Priestia taiwanensis]
MNIKKFAWGLCVLSGAILIVGIYKLKNVCTKKETCSE